MTGTLQQPPPMAPSQDEKPDIYLGFAISIPTLPAVQVLYPNENMIGVLLLGCAIRTALAASGMRFESHVFGPELNMSLGLCWVSNRQKGLEVIRDTLERCHILRFAQIAWLHPEGLWVTWYPQPCKVDFNRLIRLEVLEELHDIMRMSEQRLRRLAGQYGNKES